MNRSAIPALIDRFQGLRLLVVGDLMLDEFVWGNVSRISPEAPVPVVDVEKESWFPGGAANVARNLREFCGDVRLLAQIGPDDGGRLLRKLLGEHRIRMDWLQEDPAYRTIVKTRIIARHQQVVRVDRERKSGLTPLHAEKVPEQFAAMLPELDGVIFEDYGKGLLDQALADRLLGMARAAGKVVTVDPNPRNRIRWHGITCATPNRSEAFAIAGVAWSEPGPVPSEDGPLLEVGRRLLEVWEAEMMLVTLGESGMMLFRRAGAPHHIPTRARDVFDVSGAGDTAIALFTLALAAGVDAEGAADVANHAAGVVVGKLGTATVSPEELLASFDGG
jgi:D-beta-D-heptose 7-phosphate kinase/D-beta-D-heptose 1-phosphate adenosyltransferase